MGLTATAAITNVLTGSIIQLYDISVKFSFSEGYFKYKR
jgi:hypothetical protein